MLPWWDASFHNTNMCAPCGMCGGGVCCRCTSCTTHYAARRQACHAHMREPHTHPREGESRRGTAVVRGAGTTRCRRGARDEDGQRHLLQSGRLLLQGLPLTQHHCRRLAVHVHNFDFTASNFALGAEPSLLPSCTIIVTC